MTFTYSGKRLGPRGDAEFKLTLPIIPVDNQGYMQLEMASRAVPNPWDFRTSLTGENTLLAIHYEPKFNEFLTAKLPTKDDVIKYANDIKIAFDNAGKKAQLIEEFRYKMKSIGIKTYIYLRDENYLQVSLGVDWTVLSTLRPIVSTIHTDTRIDMSKDVNITYEDLAKFSYKECGAITKDFLDVLVNRMMYAESIKKLNEIHANSEMIVAYERDKNEYNKINSVRIAHPLHAESEVIMNFNTGKELYDALPSISKLTSDLVAKYGPSYVPHIPSDAEIEKMRIAEDTRLKEVRELSQSKKKIEKDWIDLCTELSKTKI